jgi:hypothetical protein
VPAAAAAPRRPDAAWTSQALPPLLVLATMFGVGVSDHALRTASDAEQFVLPGLAMLWSALIRMGQRQLRLG